MPFLHVRLSVSQTYARVFFFFSWYSLTNLSSISSLSLNFPVLCPRSPPSPTLVVSVLRHQPPLLLLLLWFCCGWPCVVWLPPQVVVLDTIPLSPDCANNPKIIQLSVAHLLAQAVYNIHHKKSISALFK